MRRAFGTGAGTLVLIADPKQAVYAFRGATYTPISSSEAAASRATLDINWRSDQRLIDAYDTTFGGAKLGHEGIVYRRVRAAEANQASRLSSAPHDARAPRSESCTATPIDHTHAAGFASNGSAREHIAKDLAADLVEMLSSAAEIEHAPRMASPSTASACVPAMSQCSFARIATPR